MTLNRLKMWALKAGVVVLLAAVGAAAFASPSQPEKTEAGPTGIVAFNRGVCATLAIAFGGLAATDAIGDCDFIMDQNATDLGMQHLLRCLRGGDLDHDGDHDCLAEQAPGESPLQAEAADFAGIDLDANQFRAGQPLVVIALVDDDAPVRFKTTEGVFIDEANQIIGDEYFCEVGTHDFTTDTWGDPDCDGDPATEGDGAVAVRIRIGVVDELTEGSVTAIQEGIGFPLDYTITGPPDEIELAMLFGKTVIQEGATVPTSSPTIPGNPDPLPTACDFQASVAGVLGANAAAEKAVIVAKAFDEDGNELSGALLNWDHPFEGNGEHDIAGVALPQTPTIDTGALGLAFPQFVCGKSPGVVTMNVTFDQIFEQGFADSGEEASIDITVVGEPANISLTVEPAVVQCNGTNSATVTATVTDSEGNNAANGADVSWSVQVLGNANPLVSDTTDAKATTVVTPLSGASRGVPVIATAGDVQASTLVQCSEGGAPSQPAPGAPAAPGAPSGRPGGSISGPDTGSGGDLGGRELPVWPAVALFIGAMGLIGARFAVRRV